MSVSSNVTRQSIQYGAYITVSQKQER